MVKRSTVAFEETYTPAALENAAPLFVGPTISRRRYVALCVIVLGVFLILIGRTLDIVVVQGAQWRSVSAKNRTREVILPAARGDIRDTTGELLATSVPRFAAILFPDRLPKAPDERALLFAHLSATLGIALDDLTHALETRADAEYVVLKDQLLKDDALPLMASLTSDAVEVVFRPERAYRVEQGFGNLLGFTGRVGPQEYAALKKQGYRPDDLLGKQGVESAFEQTLRGEHGAIVYEVSADGKSKGPSSERFPTVGQTINLTVNAALQRRIIEAEKKFAPGKKGAAVVVDVETGALRALVTVPDFSPNDFVGADSSHRVQALLSDRNQPLFFRPVSGQYPPGSTIKPFLATGLLASNGITPTTSVESRGGVRIRDAFFPDWKAGGHGRTNVIKALAESVNTFFYLAVGGYPFSDGQYPKRDGIGPNAAHDIAQRFGFTERTAVDLPAEAAGFFPTPEWKQAQKHEPWYIGDTYHLAIGQGDVLVTPLQIAMAMASIANGGTLWKPSIIDTKTDGSDRTVVATHPIALRTNVFPEAALQVVQEGLRAAVEKGSARRLGDLSIQVSGKTGTAQWHQGRLPHSWFTGFAPSKNPKIAVVVLVEEGGEGSGPALSIAKEIFQWYAENAAKLSS